MSPIHYAAQRLSRGVAATRGPRGVDKIKGDGWPHCVHTTRRVAPCREVCASVGGEAVKGRGMARTYVMR